MTATRPADFAQTVFSPVNGFPVHEANELTKGGNQALIVLNDQVYNLRITRAGKLILTK
ncbi:MAG: hemin uptake protein HemP [Paracoccus sp. (in: a-proteobacteria)]|nr:hemin uptake protein HemP [Paracoccus sp. (in: a-proteobacteria)]